MVFDSYIEDIVAAVVTDSRLDGEITSAGASFGIKRDSELGNEVRQQVKMVLIEALKSHLSCGRVLCAIDFWWQVDFARAAPTAERGRVPCAICDRLNGWIKDEILKLLRQLPKERLCDILPDDSRTRRMLWASEPLDPLHEMISDEDRERAWTAIDQLNPKKREAVIAVPATRLYRKGEIGDEGLLEIEIRSKGDPNAETIKDYPVNDMTKKRLRDGRSELRQTVPDLFNPYTISAFLFLVLLPAIEVLGKCING